MYVSETLRDERDDRNKVLASGVTCRSNETNIDKKKHMQEKLNILIIWNKIAARQETKGSRCRKGETRMREKDRTAFTRHKASPTPTEEWTTASFVLPAGRSSHTSLQPQLRRAQTIFFSIVSMYVIPVQFCVFTFYSLENEPSHIRQPPSDVLGQRKWVGYKKGRGEARRGKAREVCRWVQCFVHIPQSEYQSLPSRDVSEGGFS